MNLLESKFNWFVSCSSFHSLENKEEEQEGGEEEEKKSNGLKEEDSFTPQMNPWNLIRNLSDLLGEVAEATQAPRTAPGVET